jgi:zinc transporter, ZIP family
MFNNVLIYTLIPVAATVIGSAITAWRSPGKRMKSIVQHFAAGVVFSAAAGELLPDIVHTKSLWVLSIGGAIGIVTMFTIKQVSEKASGSLSLLLVVGLDILIDGLVTGISFSAGVKQGILLTIALTIEFLFLGLSVTGSLSENNISQLKTTLITLGIALLFPIGAVVGLTVLGGLPSSVLAGFFVFGLVAMLYLVTEELLVEAHKVPDTPFNSAMFFVGFLLLVGISELMA